MILVLIIGFRPKRHKKQKFIRGTIIDTLFIFSFVLATSSLSVYQRYTTFTMTQSNQFYLNQVNFNQSNAFGLLG